eukprot:CAMPEP_0180197614 /NCGR_PEP_ID=MMETSP0987-20121128/4727_1 /TAXON_ID=697907 /ORGANISM="non described non described, Strain CCMP2293" /LENGTH=158 /DNA_ID=CAMNT_0022152559 /DNA_START=27 /DNA_END=501 /DNA_ORIENTATION=+
MQALLEDRLVVDWQDHFWLKLLRLLKLYACFSFSFADAGRAEYITGPIVTSTTDFSSGGGALAGTKRVSWSALWSTEKCEMHTESTLAAAPISALSEWDGCEDAPPDALTPSTSSSRTGNERLDQAADLAGALGEADSVERFAREHRCLIRQRNIERL